MLTKEELIKKIEEMPENIQVFCSEGKFDDVDIRVFTKPKEQEFLDWYFMP